MLLLLLLVAAPQDPVDQLFRRAAELHSLSAVYALTMPGLTEPMSIRADYVTPASVRVDIARGKELTSIWCVDGTLAMDSPTVAGRADGARAFAELAPLEKVLLDAFPNAEPRPLPASAVGHSWTFDSTEQRANFSMDAQLREPDASPLGWLSTLRQKSAVPREDGELLRFETDGHFKLALSKASALLQDFVGTSPKGEIHLALVSSEVDRPVDPARFTIAGPRAEARDISPDLVRSVRRVAEASLRRRIYEAIGRADSVAAWDEPARAKTAAVWRAFHEHLVTETAAGKLEKLRTIQDNVGKRLANMRASGKGADEVEAVRQREREYLVKQLDTLEGGFVMSSAPETRAVLPRAAAILAQEQEVLADVFRTLVREPVLAGFDSATKP